MNKLNTTILLCVETTKQADTDSAYIIETIRNLYEYNPRITVKLIYMGSKSRYNSKAVQSEINKYASVCRDIHVVYCIDTDDLWTSPAAVQQFDQITAYCNSNKHDLVFFCRDIEEVYWGTRVSDTEKVRMAIRFRSAAKIRDINPNLLSHPDPQIHCSNILTILDKYWKRKTAQEYPS